MLGLGGDDPQRLGPYRLRAVIGDGGMGRVYLATSPAGRAVAVKVIGPGMAEQPGYRERFAREARAAMAVSGLYTASVVDADTAGEHPYIATEYVPAPSLAESVAETGPLPPQAVFALAGGLAEALTAIHRAGLVHRDIKPHNILLAADGPVVIDFGIARGDETSITTTGMTVGTPGYMAPEVLHGQDPSPASDVFALGSVLVYAARGTGPYGTGDPLLIVQRSANGEPDLSGLPPEVRSLVTPMLNRDPARRPTPAQLLQHVSLSSSVVLHDGLWLPDGVRNLLSRRKRELQQALSSAGPAAAGMDPTAAELPPPHVRSTLPGEFAAPYSDPRPPLPPPVPTSPYPPRRSSRGFVALLSVGGVLVMGGAIAAVLLLSKNNDDKSNSSSGTTRPASVQAAGDNHSAQSSPTSSVSASASASATDSASPETSGSDGSGGSVLNYKAGTYTVNQQLAEDAFDDTVTVDSVTVGSDGSISVQLTYTDADPGTWSCAGETADEASLQIDSDAADVSTGNDCTRDPYKSWYMTTGQTTSGSMYFSQAPEGSGPWTFSLDNEEFQGSVSGISIPTQ